MSILHQQYHLLRERRETFFEYCESLHPAHLGQGLESFGGRSIGFMLVHVADTYFSWLGDFTGLGKDPAGGGAFDNMKKARLRFDQVNALANAFLDHYQPEFNQLVTNHVAGRELALTLTPLQLFTHVITHEYHHKGQAVSMSRQLGYEPIDTDLVRFA